MPTGAEPATTVPSEAASGDVVVADASAILAVLIDPSAVGDAIAHRLSTGAVIAPALLPFEVTNVLRRRRNSGLLSERDAVLALRCFGDLPIDLWPWTAFAERAWQLGRNLSSYDASYVALAEHVGAPLVSRDARIGRAPGPRCTVEVF